MTIGRHLELDVVVDNFNYGRFLGEAIESALRQTYPRVKVIVVDDGSTDDSRAVIRSFGDRVVAVLKENGGQASALNAGFTQSSGDVVVFLDADDMLAPDTAARVVDAFSEDPSLAKVQYRMEVIDERGRNTGVLKPEADVPLPEGDLRREVLAFPFDVTWIATSGNAFSSRALRRIFPIPEEEFRQGADWYVIHLASLLGTVAALEEVGAYYRVHGGNSYELQRPSLDLVHVRQSIAYASRARRHLERLADDLELAYPSTGILSVSELANRLISLKLDPRRHPIEADTVAKLTVAGARASMRRFDVTAAMKALFIGWFAACALAPRPLARSLAELFLVPERRRGANRILRRLHRRPSSGGPRLSRTAPVRRKVYHYTDSNTFGGAEQAMLRSIARLDRARWEATLVYHPSPALDELAERARQLGAGLWSTAPMPDGVQGLRASPRFAWELRSRRPDVFHAHLSWPLACKFGLAAAVLARVPAVVATEQLFFEFRPSASSAAQQRLLAFGIDRYIAVSRHTAERLRHKLGLPPQKIEVVPNAIDIAEFERPRDPRLQTELAGAEGHAVVLTVARLHEQKGHRYLLEAAAAVPDARFVLAGDGPERGSLEAQARALGLEERVLFLGQRRDIGELLACCDVLVLPSLYEGLPLAVLEAMAAAKPVVASAIGGTDEAVVDRETGLLVPPRDAHALAGAINELLSDPERARAMGAAGRERVRRHYSTDQPSTDPALVYEQVLAARDGWSNRRAR